MCFAQAKDQAATIKNISGANETTRLQKKGQLKMMGNVKNLNKNTWEKACNKMLAKLEYS